MPNAVRESVTSVLILIHRILDRLWRAHIRCFDVPCGQCSGNEPRCDGDFRPDGRSEIAKEELELVRVQALCRLVTERVGPQMRVSRRIRETSAFSRTAVQNINYHRINMNSA
jgi:hypothetical protein